MQENAYSSATSRTLQTPSRCTLWKITSTARKSMNEIMKAPTRSSANDVRYWSCELICAPTSRRQRRTLSTTLHHQLARAEPQRQAAEPEQHERPEHLQREHAGHREAVVLAEPEVDRRLQRRGERQCVGDCPQPGREEREREHQPREEHADRDRQRHNAPHVDQPE